MSKKLCPLGHPMIKEKKGWYCPSCYVYPQQKTGEWRHLKNPSEQEANDHFEQLCGGSEKAFSLMRLYLETEQDWRPVVFGSLGRKSEPLAQVFRAKALRRGYTDAQISAFLGLQSNPKDAEIWQPYMSQGGKKVTHIPTTSGMSCNASHITFGHGMADLYCLNCGAETYDHGKTWVRAKEANPRGVPAKKCPKCGRGMKHNIILGSDICYTCKKMWYPAGHRYYDPRGISVPIGRNPYGTQEDARAYNAYIRSKGPQYGEPKPMPAPQVARRPVQVAVRGKENPVKGAVPPFFKGFHGAEPTKMRKVRVAIPDSPVAVLGKMTRIDYVVEANGRQKGQSFTHRAGDLGSKVLKSNTLVVADKAGNLFLVKDNPNSPWPKVEANGIIG